MDHDKIYKDVLLKKIEEEAKKEQERVDKLLNEFKQKKGRQPTKKEKNELNGRVAQMISIVFDLKSENTFTATSGYSPPIEDFHPKLRSLMPNPGLEPKDNLEVTRRHPKECAEVQAVNDALKARIDAKIEDFIIATFKTKSIIPRERCENCKVTLKDAIVYTDKLAQKEFSDD